MKVHYPCFRLLIFLVLLSISYSFKHTVHNNATPLSGAWHLEEGSRDHILIFTDNYYTYTAYEKGNKVFTNSQGGVYEVQNDQVITKLEFNTDQNEQVGQSNTYKFSTNTGNLTVEINGDPINFQKIDDGSGPLAGTWRISGRMEEGKVSPINNGPRKTIKILSGTRFQWAAINPETKEFFGTGGGTYTFTNGKYTESIEFFSRDSSRVGMSLSFDGKVENSQWHHSGKSSKGEAIHEIWSKVK